VSDAVSPARDERCIRRSRKSKTTKVNTMENISSMETQRPEFKDWLSSLKSNAQRLAQEETEASQWSSLKRAG
jgi:hypothetical protein